MRLTKFYGLWVWWLEGIQSEIYSLLSSTDKSDSVQQKTFKIAAAASSAGGFLVIVTLPFVDYQHLIETSSSLSVCVVCRFLL